MMRGQGKPAGAQPTMKMSLAIPTHAKLKGMVDMLTQQKGRQVTFSEAIDILYEHWAADQVKGAGR